VSVVAFNIERSEVRILTDTASFLYDDGAPVPGGFTSKVVALPHLHAAVAITGAGAFFGTLVDVILRSPLVDFDELASGMRALIAQTFHQLMVRADAGIEPQIPYQQQIFLFGLSPAAARMRALWWLHHNDFMPDGLDEGTRFVPNHTTEPAPQRMKNPLLGLKAIAEAQFATYAKHLGTAPPLGGGMIYTVIARSGITTRELSFRYPNYDAVRDAVRTSPNREALEATPEQIEEILRDAREAEPADIYPDHPLGAPTDARTR
jgi:hypothetical protein